MLPDQPDRVQRPFDLEIKLGLNCFNGIAGDSPTPVSLLRMRRLGGRAILLFGAYAALLLAVVVAGFLGQAVGIWASVLWGVVVITCLVLFMRRRSRRPQVTPSARSESPAR